VDEDPPVDEEPPDGGETPWDEPPTGETQPPWGQEPADDDDEDAGERPPRGGGAHDDDEPSWEEEPPAEGEPAHAPHAGPLGEHEEPHAAPQWVDEHPTSEQLPFEELTEGELAAAAAAGEDEDEDEDEGESEGEAGETAPAGEDEEGEIGHEEPPWGSGPPPWERGGFWGDDEEEPGEGEGEGEGAPSEGAAVPLAAEDLTTRRARQRVEARRAGQRRLLGLIIALVIVIVVVVVATGGGSGTPTTTGTNGTTTTGSKFAHAGKGHGHLAIKLETSELPENVLIADRNNNRLLAISPTGQIVDVMKQNAPSDAYLSSTGHTVYVTEHAQSVVLARIVDNGSIAYTYGIKGKPGTGNGFLHDPQTAQETPTGDIVIADRGNCRVLFVNPNKAIQLPVATWGTPGECTHHVNSLPMTFAYPDAAFAATNGDIVVTETNPGWVDVLNKDQQLISAVQLPDFIEPSDANEYAPNHFIVVDHAHPGKVEEVDYSSSNTTLSPIFTWAPTSGSGELNKPTLAIVLPGGDIMVADAGNDRVIVIDPTLDKGAGKIVWQYGHRGHPGKNAGYLHTPDSVALVPNEPPGG